MSSDDELLERIEQDPGLNTYERAVIILLRRLHERAAETDKRLADHINSEDGLLEAWSGARAAAKVLSVVVAVMSVVAGGWTWAAKHFSVTLRP